MNANSTYIHAYICLVTDINECDRGTDTCDEQLCRNTVPGFDCYCLRGYAKDVSSSGGSTTNVCVGEYHPTRGACAWTLLHKQ